MEITIQKIVSMIVQNLRTKNHTELIDIIKKADYTLDFLEHDNWNGGIDYYRLQFHLQYSDYSTLLPQKQQFEQILDESLNSFYKDEQNIITGIEIVSKIEQFLDWAAVTPKYTKESLIAMLDEEKNYLIKVGTGALQIKDTDVNKTYKATHSELVHILKQLGVEHVNCYADLWEWFNDYKKQNLETYQSRREYINTLYKPLYNILIDSEVSTKSINTNTSEKNSHTLLSNYLKENLGFDSPLGHIEINISENLGQGGNGIVYLGKYGISNLAIKFLVNYNSKKLSRFKAEYLNISIVRNRLQNIVNYISYGELNVDDSSFPYIIMEVYEMSLKQYRRTLSEISFSRVIDLFDTLCNSLKALEEQTIIHRDLKPENILVDKDGNFYITDFGIAHFSSENFPINGLTKKGERLANFEFSAPEQIQGKELSYATDIYALFQLIYWFVFEEVNRGTGGKHLYDQFSDPDAIYLDSLLYKGISNSPLDRFQNVQEIKEEFDKMRFTPKEINPFDDMHVLSSIARSTVPEFFNNAAYIDNQHEIKSLIEKINSAKTNRPFEFNTGTSNNTIDQFIQLDNGNYLLNFHELYINRIWGCIGNESYNDIVLLETSTPKPYIINEQEEYAVAVINSSEILPIRDIESGYVRYKDKVQPIHELQIQERYIYPDSTEKYFVIGAFAHCTIIQKNDGILDVLQEKLSLTRDDILSYRSNITKNKSRELYMYL